jgi:2,3-bisphosphoglycerate-dependent phosphoglycerate mutase
MLTSSMLQACRKSIPSVIFIITIIWLIKEICLSQTLPGNAVLAIERLVMKTIPCLTDLSENANHALSYMNSNIHSILILVRHGQSLWNKENRFTGWQDVDLSEAGIQEAIKAGIRLRKEQIDIAFTSSLKRAQHTLDLILEKCGLTHIPIFKDKHLNERSYGNLEGLNKSETALKYGEAQVLIWRRSFDIAPPGGESLKTTSERVLSYFRSAILPKLKEGRTVLIVAHGNSLRALVMYLEKLSPEAIMTRELPTGMPIKYSFNSAQQLIKTECLT